MRRNRRVRHLDFERSKAAARPPHPTHEVTLPANVIYEILAALPTRKRQPFLTFLRERGLSDVADRLQGDRRGRYPRHRRTPSWIDSAYRLLMRLHRETGGDPEAIIRRLDFWTSSIKPVRDSAAAFRAVTGFEAPIIPFDVLHKCDHKRHAQGATPSQYATGVLAEATSRTDEAVSRQVERIGVQKLKEWNSVRATVGMKPIGRPGRGRRQPRMYGTEYLETARRLISSAARDIGLRGTELVTINSKIEQLIRRAPDA